MNKEKKTYLEIMRIIAILFVVFNHTGTDGFFLYQFYPMGSAKFWAGMMISIFCKFAVPLFFAVSGALLIPRFDETLSVLWKKRVFRMASVLGLISLLYCTSGG